MWRTTRQLLTLAWHTDRRRLLVATGLLSAGYLATPLVALVLGSFVDDVLGGRATPAITGGVLLAALIMAELMCAHFAHLSYFELGELMDDALRQRLFTCVGTGTPLENQEQPEFADLLHLVQRGIGRTRSSVEAILEFGGLLLTLALSVPLLFTLDPLLGLLPLLAVVLVEANRLARNTIDTAQRAAARDDRLADHFLWLVSRPESALELRLLGLTDEVVARHGTAWDRASRRLVRGERRAAVLRCAGQLLFVTGYLGALVLVVRRVGGGTATVGDLLVALVLGIAIANRMGVVSGLLTVLREVGTTLGRLRALEDPRPAPRRPAAPAPTAAAEAIELRKVSFHYPGSSTPALRDIDLTIPVGSVVALIGENGAGKSTLSKLLCGLYQPTEGQVAYRGTEITADWLAQVSCLFQDFARFELTLAESVGLGRLPADGVPGADEPALLRALRRADALDIPRSLPDGLASVVGRSYDEGTELSGGQWQKVALARAFLREDVSLLVLDEPAASLDPRAEHALLTTFRDATAHAGITVLVTHRLSTVSLADLIVVLSEGTVAELGSHDELIGAGGLYADLYRTQHRAYR